MGLYKRSNIWWYSFTIKRVRYLISTKETTKVKANITAISLYNKYKDIVINKKVDYSSIVNKFLDLNYLDTLSISSKNGYKSVLTASLKYFKNKDIFNKDVLYTYASYLYRDKKLNTSTVRKYFKIVSCVFNVVKEVGFINENPVESLDLSNYKKENKRERYLSILERNKIKEYCTTNNNQDLLDYIEFAVETGLRLSEQLNLAWNNIDFTKQEIYIAETKTDISRTIPLTPLAYSILEKRKNLIKPFYLSKGILGYKYTKLKNDLKLQNLTWHDLRHTFATWAIKGIHSWQNNKPLELPKLQKWLGHADIKMTMRYSHLSSEDLKNEINKI